MDIQKLLKDGEKIFQHIHELAKSGKSKEAYDVIRYTNPPESWVVELPSKSNPNETYKTVLWEIQDAAMREIFGEARISQISSPIISQDKSGKFCTTVNVQYKHKLLPNEETNFDGYKIIHGIATISSPNITLLEMATPKAATMAAKNAIKSYGALFGRFLNVSEDEAQLPEQELEKVLPIEVEREKVKNGILMAETLQDLKGWRFLVFKKEHMELQPLYESRLREFSKK